MRKAVEEDVGDEAEGRHFSFYFHEMENHWGAFRNEDKLSELGFNRITLVLIWRI